MIEPTPEQIEYYRQARLGDGSRLGWFLADALRDRTAEVMRLEFEAEHEEFRSVSPGDRGDLMCVKCGVESNFDPRHTWTWPQWQQAAHEKLTGGNPND